MTITPLDQPKRMRWVRRVEAMVELMTIIKKRMRKNSSVSWWTMTWIRPLMRNTVVAMMWTIRAVWTMMEQMMVDNVWRPRAFGMGAEHSGQMVNPSSRSLSRHSVW